MKDRLYQQMSSGVVQSFFRISYFFAWLDCKRLKKSQYVMKVDFEPAIVFQAIDP